MVLYTNICMCEEDFNDDDDDDDDDGDIVCTKSDICE